ncbi:MAG: hypothetical protein QM722_00485 [Piscinibacter sp.]
MAGTIGDPANLGLAIDTADAALYAAKAAGRNRVFPAPAAGRGAEGRRPARRLSSANEILAQGRRERLPERPSRGTAVTPAAARLSAAIEVLADIEARQPAPRTDALKDWGLDHRFAGSGDRAAIASLVYDALRRRASAAWRGARDSARRPPRHAGTARGWPAPNRRHSSPASARARALSPPALRSPPGRVAAPAWSPATSRLALPTIAAAFAPTRSRRPGRSPPAPPSTCASTR